MMLREFLNWWLRQLSECIPKRLRPAAQYENALILEPRRGELNIARRRRGAEMPLGSFSLDEAGLARAKTACGGKRAPAILVLPPGSLLERLAELPLAAERNLDRVIGYEMHRLTPFRGDQVAWSARVQTRDCQRGRIEVALTIVPQTTLRLAAEGIKRLGISPIAVESETALGVVRRIALVKPELAHRESRSRVIAFAFAGVLACTAVALPFIRQTLARNEIRSEIAELAPGVARINLLRQKLSSNAARASLLRSEGKRIGDEFQLLATLTDLLPDDTVLASLAVRAGHLSFTGKSSSAARLIPLLASNSHFRNPRFAGPVTHTENNHIDLLSIDVDLEP